MTTRGGVSAFGIVHFAKSESSPGVYAPLVGPGAMSRRQRDNTQVLARDRRRDRIRGGPRQKQGARTLGATWDGHAYANRPGLDDASVSREMRQEFSPKNHTPSAKHPNIAYGSSVPPADRRTLDGMLNPEQTRRLQHTVVVHRAAHLHPGADAAAVGAHVTTGHRGHVALSPYFETSSTEARTGKIPSRDILAHELVHANVKQGPAHERGGSRSASAVSGQGEEGRADALAGVDSHIKYGLVRRPEQVKTLMATGRFDTLSRATEEVRGDARFNEVKGLIGAAKKLRKVKI